MLQESASRSACCAWKAHMLLSLLIGLCFAVLLSSVPSPSGEDQKPIMTMAWPSMQAMNAQFMQPARFQQSMQLARAWPYMHAKKLSALPGPGLEPEHVEQMPKSDWEAIVERTPSRRKALLSAVGAAAGLATTAISPRNAAAAAKSAPKNIVVAGAAGSLGSRVLERLSAIGGLNVIGGVRNVEKAMNMLKKAPLFDTSSVTLAPLNVVQDSVETMAQTLKGAQSLVISIGFVPGDPGLSFNGWKKQAEAVDNIGTIKLIDAAKEAGVKKVVMVSALLTDADAWGQRNTPVHQATNFFGGVLDQKLVAERYLRTSGLDYTILRAGGYTDGGFDKKKPGQIFISGENTLKEGEICRDNAAKVTVDALFNPDFNNKVIEVVERRA